MCRGVLIMGISGRMEGRLFGTGKEVGGFL